MSDLTALDSLLSKLPSGWSSPAIASVARLINGRGFKPHEWETDGLPIIRIQNLNGSTDFNYYSGSYNPKIEVNTGDLLFAWSGSRGTSFGPHFWSGPKGVLNYHTWRVKVDESAIAPDFFYHALRFLTRIIEDRAHGASALVHVQKWEMEKFGFPCPNDRAEQQAIATALSDADGVVAGLERVIAKKRLIKQGAMQDLLTARRRLPGFSGEWEVKKLGSLVKVTRGASPRPIESPVWFDENSSVGWVRISDLSKSGIYLKATTQRLSQEGIRRSRRVEISSLIMSIAATLGRPAITKIDVCIHDGFVVLTDLKIDKFFLFHLLKSLEPMWALQGQTGSQMNLNTGIIEGTGVRVPATVAEQEAIAMAFNHMDAEIEALESRLAKARAVKEGMMQTLLTGRVRLV